MKLVRKDTDTKTGSKTMTHICWKALCTLAAVGLSVLAVGAILRARPLPQDSSHRTALLSRTGRRAGNDQAALQSGTARADLQTSPPSVSYSFGLVDVPFSTDGAPFGINDLKQMVGAYNNLNLTAFPADHGFAFKGKGFAAIDYPSGLQTAVYGINKSGEVVGMFVDNVTGRYHGFKLVGTTFTQLDYPGADDTVALGVNSSGDIVGIWDTSSSQANGFMLSGGVYSLITVPGAESTYAEGINKSGVIVGYYFDSIGNSHGLVDKGGVQTTIDYPGYPDSYLAGVSDIGPMVGGYGSPTTIGSTTYIWQHGFVYSGGTFSSFDVPFGDVAATEPYGMNNHGEIVGGYVDSAGMTYGFYAKATP
jgi:hypothetical protein